MNRCANDKAPPGYWCSRETGHEGPCAAHPICGHDRFTFHHPLDVPCPCLAAPGVPCTGMLQYEGHNVARTRAFLICSNCKCCYMVDNTEE